MKKVRTAIETHYAIHLDDVGAGAVSAIKARFTRDNPKWWNNKRLGFSNWNVERKLRSWRIEDDWLLLPRGARGEVEAILDKRGYEPGPVWDRTIKLEPLKLELHGTLRPYQDEASDKLVAAGTGALRGPCASGKTVIMLAAIAKLQQPTIVVVHSDFLFRQWRAGIAEWLDYVPGALGAGKENLKPITVAMQQTLCRRRGAPWVREFGCLMADELQHWGAKTFQTVAGMFPARYRLGCSADERRKDGKHAFIYETFGECVHKIGREELEQLGRLVPTRMEIVPTAFESEAYLAAVLRGEPPDWGSMLDDLTSDDERCTLIADHADRILKQRGTRVLMLTERVAACGRMAREMRERGHRCASLVGGHRNKEAVERAVQQMRAGHLRCAVGTQVADEGLDIPALTHVLVTCPVHNHPRRLQQMVGRAAREHGRKREGVCVYFWDRMMFPAPDPEQDSGGGRAGRERAFQRRLGSVCGSWGVVK